MADEVEMIALGTIHRGGRMFSTGRSDAKGDPVFTRESETVARGTRFTVTREEADELLRMDAAEEVTP